MEIIPIIKNCKKYNKDLDVMSPKCPAPPYKQGFKEFIKKLKKDLNKNKYKSLSNEKKSKVILNKKSY